MNHGWQSESMDGWSEEAGASGYLSVYHCLSVYLPACLSINLPICLSTYISIHLSICQSIFLYFFLFIYPSIYLPTYLSTYPSIYPSFFLVFSFYIFPSSKPKLLCKTSFELDNIQNEAFLLDLLNFRT